MTDYEQIIELFNRAKVDFDYGKECLTDGYIVTLYEYQGRSASIGFNKDGSFNTEANSEYLEGE